MTQVRSSGGAQAPFATPVSKGKAKAASQPPAKTAAPHPVAAKPAAGAGGKPAPGTQVTFGEEALHALENTGALIGKALVTGVEDVGQAAWYTAKALGTGVVDVAKGIESALGAGVHGTITGIEDTVGYLGNGVVHLEHALSDAWGVATTGAAKATTLATTLGDDAEVVVTNLGNAATDVGVGAKAVLSGVGSIASTAASYGTYVVKQGAKVLNELT